MDQLMTRQYVVRYPEGFTKDDNKLLPNKEMAQEIIKGLIAGNHVIIPNTWTVQVINLDSSNSPTIPEEEAFQAKLEKDYPYDELGKCQRCNNGAQELHTCPYKTELYNSSMACNCCLSCMHQCAQDI
jgi:hypothetical protein